MKKSKKLFGLFAFLLVCANVNAGSVGAPQEYPHIRYNYDIMSMLVYLLLVLQKI